MLRECEKSATIVMEGKKRHLFEGMLENHYMLKGFESNVTFPSTNKKLI
jgi:hypothetical protein